jgi:hypothetical protein
MIKMTEADIKSWVTYVPFKGCDKSQWEPGIVKSFNNDRKVAWVVYKCNNDWDHYENYTAACTNFSDLSPGSAGLYAKTTINKNYVVISKNHAVAQKMPVTGKVKNVELQVNAGKGFKWVVFKPGVFIDLHFPFIHKGFVCELKDRLS